MFCLEKEERTDLISWSHPILRIWPLELVKPTLILKQFVHLCTELLFAESVFTVLEFEPFTRPASINVVTTSLRQYQNILPALRIRSVAFHLLNPDMRHEKEACRDIFDPMIATDILPFTITTFNRANIERFEIGGVEQCRECGMCELRFPSHCHPVNGDALEDLDVVLANLRQEVEERIETHELDFLPIKYAGCFLLDLLVDNEKIQVELCFALFGRILFVVVLDSDAAARLLLQLVSNQQLFSGHQ
jgi:hypothetical protein